MPSPLSSGVTYARAIGKPSVGEGTPEVTVPTATLGAVAALGNSSQARLAVVVGETGEDDVSPAVPTVITVTEAAATKIKELLAEEGKTDSGLRVFVQGGGCSGFQYGLMIEEGGAGVGDQAFESNGVKLFVDPVSISYLKGAEVDFVDTVTGGGFTIKNPNATSTCGCGSSFSV